MDLQTPHYTHIWAEAKQEVTLSFKIQNMGDDVYLQSGVMPHFELFLYASDSGRFGEGTQTDISGATGYQDLADLHELILHSGEIVSLREFKVVKYVLETCARL